MKFNYSDKIAITVILLLFILAFILVDKVPEKMPIHWNAKGEVDGYAGKYLGLFLFPCILLGVYLFFLFIPRIAVHKDNIERFHKQYDMLKITFVFFFTAIYLFSLMPNFGYKFNMNLFVIPLVAFLFFFIGEMLPHTKRNYFVGVRTPWALSNEMVWKKTHWLGGWTFRINAFVLAFMLFIPDYFFIVLMVSVVANILVLFAYSYLVWLDEGAGKTDTKNKGHSRKN